MKTLLLTIFVTLTSTLALAGQVETAPRKEKGINEAVTIQKLGTTWGFETEANGFYVGGKSVFKLVPVTREAAQVLQSLDKKAQYNCIVQNSTYVYEKNEGLGGGTYYVIDINCN